MLYNWLMWENRIVGESIEDPAALLANPCNWRTHPKHQKDAMRGALEELGWIQRAVVNKRTGRLIDGHLRVELAKEAGAGGIPVIFVDLSEEEELVALASIDSITGLAETDQAMLDALVISSSVENAALDEFLQSLRLDPELLEEVDFSAGTEDEQGRLDELSPKYCTCPNCGTEFDIRKHG